MNFSNLPEDIIQYNILPFIWHDRKSVRALNDISSEVIYRNNERYYPRINRYNENEKFNIFKYIHDNLSQVHRQYNLDYKGLHDSMYNPTKNFLFELWDETFLGSYLIEDHALWLRYLVSTDPEKKYIPDEFQEYVHEKRMREIRNELDNNTFVPYLHWRENYQTSPEHSDNDDEADDDADTYDDDYDDDDDAGDDIDEEIYDQIESLRCPLKI